MLPKTVISRYSNTYAKKPKRLGIWVLPFGRLKMVTSTYSNILLSVSMINIDEWACNWAAKYGHLDCLKYLHETAKAPWDSLAVRYAHDYNHTECLQYLLDNNCPLPRHWRYEAWRVTHLIKTLTHRGRQRERERHLQNIAHEMKEKHDAIKFPRTHAFRSSRGGRNNNNTTAAKKKR